MKTKIFFLLALLLSAWGVHATTDDTISVFRARFDHKLLWVQFEGYCNVTIVPDTVEYLEFVDPVRGVLDYKRIRTSYSGRKNDNLTLSADPGVGAMRLHLIMHGLNHVYVKEYANVTMAVPDSVSRIIMMTKDYSQLTIVPNGGEVDTLRVQSIDLCSKHYSNISMNVPCVADNAKFTATEYSKIHVAYCGGENMIASEDMFSKVTVDHYNVFHTEMTGPYFGDVSQPTHRIRHDDFRIDYLWGFTNWGTTPWNAFSTMYDDYDISTTFSSYQLEATYFPYINQTFSVGIGLGYESDVYKFRNGKVSLACSDVDGTVVGTFVSTQDDSHVWRSRLVARYVTMPITLQFSPDRQHPSFFLGLTLVPGLNFNNRKTGLTQVGENIQETIITHDPIGMAGFMQSFKFDVRLSLAWTRYLYGFVQLPTMPLFDGMDKKIYPVKLGFVISLGNRY